MFTKILYRKAHQKSRPSDNFLNRKKIMNSCTNFTKFLQPSIIVDCDVKLTKIYHLWEKKLCRLMVNPKQEC